MLHTDLSSWSASFCPPLVASSACSAFWFRMLASPCGAPECASLAILPTPRPRMQNGVAASAPIESDVSNETECGVLAVNGDEVRSDKGDPAEAESSEST